MLKKKRKEGSEEEIEVDQNEEIRNEDKKEEEVKKERKREGIEKEEWKSRWTSWYLKSRKK